LALAHDWKPDVIFAHHSCLNGWIAMSMSEEMGVPFFCQDHALWDISACNEHPKRKRMLRSIAARATAMIVVSQRMAADLRKVAPDARIEVLHNGADLPVFPQQCVSSATKPSVIFSAGMLIPYKAFDILLQAWALVCARFPEARLRIAGDGPERNSLMQLRHVLKIEDSVEFLGYLPQSEVHAEMAAARAFVLASWHETFGVVLLEGAAEGTPVVWASNAGAAEVLQNGVHGLVIEPHNVESAAAAIDYMLTHPEQAAIMGNAARNLVREGFTWDAVARKAIALFSAAIAPAA
jgi:glycosyltransferase involved in cell wall biosynthesis